MGRVYYFLTMMGLAGLAASATQLLPPPVIPDGFESGRAVTTNTAGSERWTSRWSMREELIEGQQVVTMTEEGEGQYSGFESEVRWRTDTVWLRDEVFRPLRSEKIFSDPNGTPLLRERTDFDHTNHILHFEREDLRTGETVTETLDDMPDDTLSVEGIAAALRAMPFGEDGSVRAHLFTPEPSLYEVTLAMRGRETLTTPNGSVECYKVEIVPRLGILGVFRFFLPKAYFWFAVDAPHSWIRFKGPENGRGTPNITMERIN